LASGSLIALIIPLDTSATYTNYNIFRQLLKGDGDRKKGKGGGKEGGQREKGE
jgi:hypothetical protein